MKERHKAVPASYLIVRRDEQILLMLRQNTGYYDGWYTVPSGHVEADELPIDAMIREAREEIGIGVERSAMRHALTMYRTRHDETGDRADYFFETSEWSGTPANCEPEKCDAVEWFDVSSLPEHLMHHVRDAIEAIARGETYLELGRAQTVSDPTRAHGE